MYRVLVIQSYGNQKGGSARFLLNLLSSINREIFDICVLFLSPGYLIEKIRELEIPVYLGNSGRLLNIFCLIRSVRLIMTVIKKEKIDIVFSNDVRSHIYGGIAARLVKVYSLCYWHGIFNRRDTVSKVAVAIPSNAFVFNSEFNRDRFLSTYPEITPRTYTVYPGIYPEDNKVKALNGFDSSLNYISMIGLLMKWKGQEYFIKAAQQIVEKFPKTRFLIVGDIQSQKDILYKKYLKDLVSRLQLEECISFTGYREDIYSIIRASNIIIHASTSPEPFGMVIIEAMACGKPVVATNMGGPVEIIDNGIDGVLVPFGDEKAIADACIKLLENQSLAKKIGERARMKVERQFTAKNMSEKMGSIFESIMPG